MNEAAQSFVEMRGSLRKPLGPRDGVLALSGYGIRVTVERGHLLVADGIGAKRRQGRFSRVDRDLKRLVILGHSGTVSLEALRWLHDIKAAFVQIDADGRLIGAMGPDGLDDARLRRAQALAAGSAVGLKISRSLLDQKLNAQARVAEQLPAGQEAISEIRRLLIDLSEARSVDEMRGVEGGAAKAYWAAWEKVPVSFEQRDGDRIPEHWKLFGQRQSLLSKPSPRRATNPPNAILNYLYAILEAEARIAVLRMGLDPGLGFSHADQKARDSLACDVMEPVRPKVDAFVLDLLRKQTFRKADFFETREGVCRVMPPLTTDMLGHTAGLWAKELGPVVEGIARMLTERSDGSKANRVKPIPAPTPLTESNRSRGRESYRRGRPAKAAQKPGIMTCNSCGNAIAWREPPHCSKCWVRAFTKGKFPDSSPMSMAIKTIL